ncbi:hypothetical protein NL676_001472 [Syzygium grande]|nr:hypothetical protein NL676_001472 [Syzygium grande]
MARFPRSPAPKEVAAADAAWCLPGKCFPLQLLSTVFGHGLVVQCIFLADTFTTLLSGQGPANTSSFELLPRCLTSDRREAFNGDMSSSSGYSAPIHLQPSPPGKRATDVGACRGSVSRASEGAGAQISNFSKEINMEEKCESTIKGQVPLKNEELNAKTENRDVLITDFKEEKIGEIGSPYEFIERSNPPHQTEDMAKEQKAGEGEEGNCAEKETRDEDREEITKDGEKVSNEEKKECHDESSDKLEEHEETKKEEKSKEIIGGKEKGEEEKKNKDKKEEKKKKPEADEEEEEEKKKKDKKEKKKKKKDKKCSESGEGTEAEDTEKEEKKEKKGDKKKKEKKHKDKTDEEKGGGDDSKEDEEETEGCTDVVSREVAVEEDLGKSEGEAENKKWWKHKEGKEKKGKDKKDQCEKKKECGKDKYKDIGKLKHKLEKINGKIEALLEKKAFIFGKMKDAEAKKNGEASREPAPKEVAATDAA